MAKKKEDSLLFTVKGVDVHRDSVFIVSSKKVKPVIPNYPDVKKFGSHPETFSPPFVRLSAESTSGRYDLGLDINSVHYKGVDKDVAKNTISDLKKNLFNFYIDVHNLSIKDLEYSSSQRDIACDEDKIGIYDDPNLGHCVTLYEGLELKTDNIHHLYAIYVALISKNACPNGQEGKPEYKDTPFILTDKTVRKREEKESIYKNFSIVGKLYALIESKSLNKLNGILEYCDFKTPPPKEDSDPVVFMTYISEHILNDTSSIDRVEAVIRDTDENQRDMYRSLKRELKKKDSIITKDRNQFLYKDIVLGSNLKQISQHISERSDDCFPEIRQKLLLDEN